MHFNVPLDVFACPLWGGRRFWLNSYNWDWLINIVCNELLLWRQERLRYKLKLFHRETILCVQITRTQAARTWPNCHARVRNLLAEFLPTRLHLQVNSIDRSLDGRAF